MSTGAAMKRVTDALIEAGYREIQYVEETVDERDYCWSMWVGRAGALALSRVYDRLPGGRSEPVTWQLWRTVSNTNRVQDDLDFIREARL